MSTLREPLPRPVPVNSNAGESPPGPATRHPRGARAEDVVHVLRDDGTLDPALDPRLTEPEVVGLYRAMVQSRLLATSREDGLLAAPGEEAAVIGSAFALRRQDWLFPCAGEVGAALLRGDPLQRYLGQLPYRHGNKAARVASIGSSAGAQITQAVGFAWAARLRRDELVALVYFGDDATSSAEFHNGLNFAGVFRAPSVLFCRSRDGVSAEGQTASDGFAAKGQAYGVAGVRVDGSDLFAVVEVTRDAVARAARGEGPTLIEAITGAARLDPIARVRRHLDRAAGWSDARDRQLEAEVDAEVRAAVAVAGQTPPPSLDALFDDVFAELPWHLVEQREALRRGPRARTT